MFITLQDNKRRKVFNLKTDMLRDLITFTLSKNSKKIYSTPAQNRNVKLLLPNGKEILAQSEFTSEVWENNISFKNIIGCLSVSNIIEIF